MKKSDQLGILSRFMGTFEPEVRGRGIGPVDPRLLPRIDDLCGGRMASAEARDFMAQVSTESGAIEAIAERLKSGAESHGRRPRSGSRR